MDGVAALRRAVLMAFWGLFIATTVGAEPQDDPPQDDQLQADQPQIARPNHKPKAAVHHADPAAQLRHQLRNKTIDVLVGIVPGGPDEAVDMALVLTAQTEHARLRLLPIAGAGASQN